MSVEVKFWQFSKRENSTKRPADGDSVTYRCHMKNSVTITNPVIQLGLGASENPSKYNYALIDDFHRYYFVSDWTANGNIWEASLVCDVLATYKEYIGNSSEYVIRSASNYDTSISDNLYPLKPSPSIQRVAIDRQWASTIGNGNYVLGLINKDGGATGGVSYYALRPSAMAELNNKMLGDINDYGSDWGDIGESALKAQFNPSQYITSVMWFPFALDAGGGVSGLPLGWWTLGDISGNRISVSSPFSTYNYTINIPKHPQAAARGAFLNAAPYSRYTLYFPPFGSIPIDGNLLSTATALTVTVKVDYITGLGILRILINNTVIAEESASVGVPMAISQITRDYVAASTSLVSTAASLLTGNAMGAVQGVANTVNNMFPQAKSTGTRGNIAQYSINSELVAEFYNIVGEDLEHRGRPLMQKVQVNTLSGYLVCADGDISIPSTQEENTRVKSYLEGGFYFE